MIPIAHDLDARILRIVRAWHVEGTSLDDAAFNDLALDLLRYQLQNNASYARYCAQFGVTLEALPRDWEAIPPVPTDAFKETTVATFDVRCAALAFETSGTTHGAGGRHYFENSALYDAALLAAFDRFMLADRATLRYLNLVPNPLQRPQSSLGYMMARVSNARGDGTTGWYVEGETLHVAAFVDDLRAAIGARQAVCIATTAFALVHVLDALRASDLHFTLPHGSRIMETGGFKGRSRSVDRATLYAETAERFGIDATQIVAEYGMTELTSQYYDMQAYAGDRRVKAGPPWLRARIVGADGRSLPNGTVGALVHVDLANRASCVALQTEDLGVRFDGEDGFVFLGRDDTATLRGCSLDAETLSHR